MKYFLLAITLLFLIKDNIAQTYFNKNYDYNNYLDNGGQIVKLDSTYFICNSFLNISTSNRGIMPLIMDSIGNVNKENPIVINGYPLYTSGISYFKDSTIFISGTYTEKSTAIKQSAIFKFNREGDSLNFYYYNNNIGLNSYCNDIINDNKSLFISGSIDDSLSGDLIPYLRETDDQGNSLWYKTFGTSNNDDFYSLTIGLNKEIYATGWTSGYGAIYNLIYLVKTDSLGNFIWEKTFGDKNYFNYGASITTLTDGNLLIAGASKDKGYILKIDTAGNKIFEKYVGIAENQWFLKANELIDGSIVLMGSQRNINTNNGTEGWLVKTDESGNVIWNKTYNPIGDPDDVVNDYFYDFITTDDGGFLCVGTTAARPSKTQDAWYIKLDSLGNCDTAIFFPWLVGVEDIEKIKNELFKVFPNPTLGLVNINATLQKPETVKIEVYNNLGQAISKKVLGNREIINETVDLQSFPAGIYLIAIKMGNEVKYYKVLKE